jgi:hypothetical protein
MGGGLHSEIRPHLLDLGRIGEIDQFETRDRAPGVVQKLFIHGSTPGLRGIGAKVASEHFIGLTLR